MTINLDPQWGEFDVSTPIDYATSAKSIVLKILDKCDERKSTCPDILELLEKTREAVNTFGTPGAFKAMEDTRDVGRRFHIKYFMQMFHSDDIIKDCDIAYMAWSAAALAYGCGAKDTDLAKDYYKTICEFAKQNGIDV